MILGNRTMIRYNGLIYYRKDNCWFDENNIRVSKQIAAELNKRYHPVRKIKTSTDLTPDEKKCRKIQMLKDKMEKDCDSGENDITRHLYRLPGDRYRG